MSNDIFCHLEIEAKPHGTNFNSAIVTHLGNSSIYVDSVEDKGRLMGNIMKENMLLTELRSAIRPRISPSLSDPTVIRRVTSIRSVLNQRTYTITVTL